MAAPEQLVITPIPENPVADAVDQIAAEVDPPEAPEPGPADPEAPQKEDAPSEQEDAPSEQEDAPSEQEAEQEIETLRRMAEEAKAGKAEASVQARIDAELKIRLAAQTAEREARAFVAARPEFQDQAFKRRVGETMIAKRVSLEDAYRHTKYDDLEKASERIVELERQISR